MSHGRINRKEVQRSQTALATAAFNLQFDLSPGRWANGAELERPGKCVSGDTEDATY